MFKKLILFRKKTRHDYSIVLPLDFLYHISSTIITPNQALSKKFLLFIQIRKQWYTWDWISTLWEPSQCKIQTWARYFFLVKLQASGSGKKESLAQVFFLSFAKFVGTPFFTEHLRWLLLSLLLDFSGRFEIQPAANLLILHSV